MGASTFCYAWLTQDATIEMHLPEAEIPAYDEINTCPGERGFPKKKKKNLIEQIEFMFQW